MKGPTGGGILDHFGALLDHLGTDWKKSSASAGDALSTGNARRVLYLTIDQACTYWLCTVLQYPRVVILCTPSAVP